MSGEQIAGLSALATVWLGIGLFIAFVLSGLTHGGLEWSVWVKITLFWPFYILIYVVIPFFF